MKKSTNIAAARKPAVRALVLALCGIGLASLPLTEVMANPQGGQVVAGSAGIRQETQSKVGITQTTDKAIIDWRSFSIGAKEQVQFYQPGASSVTLNRVVGQDPSQILGRLTANGQVFLVNPNGIYFGKNAQIDVAGLVASTHNIRNEDFLDGKYNFNMPGKPGAAVINEGSINIADTGIAAFVAPSVANRGVIVAKLGKVALASANGFTLDFTGDQLLTFLVGDEVAKTAFDIEGKQLTSFVDNSGRIESLGGYVLLTAKAAENAIHGVINQSGVIEATTVGTHNGEIILNAGKGSLSVSGTLDASAPNGGDGGFIETSGCHVAINPATKITTAAPFGKTGRWLIDPNDYIIATSGGDISGATLARQLANNNVTIQTASQGTPGGNGDIFVNDAVSWSSGNSLTLAAERNITINSNINGTGTNSKFNAYAPGTLTVNANVTATGSGTGGEAVHYEANSMVLIGITTAIAASPEVSTYDPNRSIRIESTPTSGVLSLTPAQFATLHADLNMGSDTVLYTQNGHITVAAEVSSNQINARFITLRADGGSITINAPITGGAGMLGIGFYAGQNITLNAPVTIPNSNLVLAAGGVITHAENTYSNPTQLTSAQRLLIQQHQNDNASMFLLAIGNGLFENSNLDAVWVGMYQNGSPTQAQVSANNLWPTYDKYRLATVSKVLEGLTNGDIVYGGAIWTALGSPSSGNMNNRNAAYYTFTHPTLQAYLPPPAVIVILSDSGKENSDSGCYANGETACVNTKKNIPSRKNPGSGPNSSESKEVGELVPTIGSWLKNHAHQDCSFFGYFCHESNFSGVSKPPTQGDMTRLSHVASGFFMADAMGDNLDAAIDQVQITQNQYTQSLKMFNDALSSTLIEMIKDKIGDVTNEKLENLGQTALGKLNDLQAAITKGDFVSVMTTAKNASDSIGIDFGPLVTLAKFSAGFEKAYKETGKARTTQITNDLLYLIAHPDVTKNVAGAGGSYVAFLTGISSFISPEGQQ